MYEHENNKWTVNYSWTQPYNQPTSFNPFYQAQTTVERELEQLNCIDLLVDEMLTYPDAEAILNKIKKDNAND